MKANTFGTISILIVFFIIGFVSRIISASLSPRAYTTQCYTETTKKDVNALSRCWLHEVQTITQYEGVSSGLQYLQTMYASYPEFASQCHEFTHEIGKQAYLMFQKHQVLSVDPSLTASCGYGFYHGLMELFMEHPDAQKKTKLFCTQLSQQASLTQQRGVRLSCYHGIGHGNTPIGAKHPAKPLRDILYGSIALCRQATNDEEEIAACASGVFNSVTIAMNAETNGLTINRNDPFAHCKDFSALVQKACYADASMLLFAIAPLDKDKQVSYIWAIPDSAVARYTMNQYIANTISKNPPLSESQFILWCRRQPEPLKDACIKGGINGIFEFGNPGNQHEQALQFCKDSLLTSYEKSVCRDELIKALQYWYSTNLITKLCNREELKEMSACKVLP